MAEIHYFADYRKKKTRRPLNAEKKLEASLYIKISKSIYFHTEFDYKEITPDTSLEWLCSGDEKKMLKIMDYIVSTGNLQNGFYNEVPADDVFEFFPTVSDIFLFTAMESKKTSSK
jgi:hypothetical protein